MHQDGKKMNIVILAAGLGSRLDSPSKLPKALTQLENGQTILSFQLQQIAHYFDINQVKVVVGNRFETIMNAFPELSFCYNPDFASENTAGSLKRALQSIQGNLLFLNGDVIFHPFIIKTLLNYGRTAMIVNEEPVGEEEVKYRTDDNGMILAVSKQVKNPKGEALGINFISQKDLPSFKYSLEKCSKNDYFEKAIEFSIEAGIEVKALPIMPNYCCEIDFLEDLKKANQMIRNWH